MSPPCLTTCHDVSHNVSHDMSCLRNLRRPEHSPTSWRPPQGIAGVAVSRASRANHVPRLPRTEHPRTNRNSERSSLPRWQFSEPAPWHHREKKKHEPIHWDLLLGTNNNIPCTFFEPARYCILGRSSARPSLAGRKFWIANVVQGCVCIYIYVYICVYVV